MIKVQKKFFQIIFNLWLVESGAKASDTVG